MSSLIYICIICTLACATSAQNITTEMPDTNSTLTTEMSDTDSTLTTEMPDTNSALTTEMSDTNSTLTTASANMADVTSSANMDDYVSTTDMVEKGSTNLEMTTGMTPDSMTSDAMLEDMLSTEGNMQESTTNMVDDMSSASVIDNMSTTEMVDKVDTTLKITTDSMKQYATSEIPQKATTSKFVPMTTKSSMAYTTKPPIATTRVTTMAMKSDIPTSEPEPQTPETKAGPKQETAAAKGNDAVTIPVIIKETSGETAFGRIGLPLFAVVLAALIILLAALGFMYFYKKRHSGTHFINSKSANVETGPTSPKYDVTAGFGNVQTIDLEEEKPGNSNNGGLTTFGAKANDSSDTQPTENGPAPETPSWLKVEPSQQSGDNAANDLISDEPVKDPPLATEPTPAAENEPLLTEDKQRIDDSEGESYNGSDDEGEPEVPASLPLLQNDVEANQMDTVDLNTEETSI